MKEVIIMNRVTGGKIWELFYFWYNSDYDVKVNSKTCDIWELIRNNSTSLIFNTIKNA